MDRDVYWSCWIVEAHCDRLGQVPNGWVEYSVSNETDFLFAGSFYIIRCNEGYFPKNDSIVTCVDNATDSQASSYFDKPATTCGEYCKLENDCEKKTNALIRICYNHKKCFCNIFSFSQRVTEICNYFAAQLIYNLQSSVQNRNYF